MDDHPSSWESDDRQQQHPGFQAAPARPITEHQWRSRHAHNSSRVTAAAANDSPAAQPAPWHSSAGVLEAPPAPDAEPAAAVAAHSTTTRWLACVYKAGVLGVAAYDRLSNELSVLQTAEESKGPAAFQMLQYIKLQVDPQVIILPATAEAALIEAAQLAAAAAAGAAAAGDGDSSGQPTVQLQRPSLFTYSKALQMVSAIQLRGQEAHQQQSLMSGRRNRKELGPAARLIDTSAQQQVAALGALVAVLLQLQIEAGPSEEPSSLLVDGISELCLEGHLIVDGPSLAALDIFKEEEHPSSMGVGSSKEGFSVYGLLQRCVTGMGRRLLRQWFLRPVVQLEVINDRHDTLELLVAAPTTNDALRAAMKKLQDLPRLLDRLRVCQARPQLATFKQLHESIKQLMALQAAVSALAPQAAAAAVAAASPGGQQQDGAAGASVKARAGGHRTAGHAQEGGPNWWGDDADVADQDTHGWLRRAGGAFDSPAAATDDPWGAAGAAASGGGLFDTPPTARGGVGAFRTAAGDGGARGSKLAAGAFAAAGGHAGAAQGLRAMKQAAGVAGGPWDKLKITQKLLKSLGLELLSCCCMISDVLDLSCALEGCLVQPGVCAPLDELRGTLEQLPAILTEYIERELARVPPHVARRHSKQLWSVMFMPQVGFVVSISGGQLSEELLDLLPDYSLAFMGDEGPAGFSGAAAAAAAAGTAAAAGVTSEVELDRSSAYYTCSCTQELNEEFGDLQHKIQDLEASICTELIKRLLQAAPALAAASNAVAELDCLCSLAAAARELGYCRPKLVPHSVIHIEGGRHPLCELLAPGAFIDNDTALGCISADMQADDAAGELPAAAAGAASGGAEGLDGPRMLLITGPNASGKSVYMKQVALLVYMAHIGSFIPARSAVIGLTDRILTRLPGMESVAQHTSSFMADLAQVSNILSRATSRSLVLLDEFGKGTLTADGVGLLAALLQHYLAQPCPPLLLACTHFSELLNPAVLPASPLLRLSTMQVLVGGGQAHTQQQQEQEQQPPVDLQQEHVFLYKLVPGMVASSYGLHCARLCGVDDAVLTRAADVLTLQQAGQPISRLQVPQLQQRDQVCWQLLQQLAGLDMSREEAVLQLMCEVVRAEAGQTAA